MSGTLFWKAPTPDSDLDTTPTEPRLPVDVPLTPEPYRKDRQQMGRVALGAVAFLVAFIFGGIAWNFWSWGVNGGSVLLAIILGGFGLFFAGLLVWGYRASRAPVLSGIRVDRTGVERRLGDGRTQAYGLRGERWRLNLLSLNAPETNAGYIGLDVSVYFADGAQGRLSHADARQLLWALRTVGLEVTRKKDWIKYAGPATNFSVRPPPSAG